MNHNGYTVEPLLYTDPEGVEHLDYQHGQVTDHSINAKLREEHQRLQEDAYYTDDNGDTHLAWEDLEDDSLEEIEPDTSLYDFVDDVIGYDTFNVCLTWAADALPQSEIDSFNAIIDAGGDRAADVIVSLYKVWLEANK